MPTNQTSTNETENTHDVVRHGRLSGTRNAEIDSLLSSMEADRYIAPYDVLVDITHLLMLADCSITAPSHAQKTMHELLLMYNEGIPEPAFAQKYEDIHAGIESTIVATVGMNTGWRLHVAFAQIKSLIELHLSLLQIAQNHIGTVMPGFTHLQRKKTQRTLLCKKTQTVHIP